MCAVKIISRVLQPMLTVMQISAGVCLGKFTKKKNFRLHVTALHYMAHYSKNKVWLKTGEQSFVYGNNVAKVGRSTRIFNRRAETHTANERRHTAERGCCCHVQQPPPGFRCDFKVHGESTEVAPRRRCSLSPGTHPQTLLCTTHRLISGNT